MSQKKGKTRRTTCSECGGRTITGKPEGESAICFRCFLKNEGLRPVVKVGQGGRVEVDVEPIADPEPEVEKCPGCSGNLVAVSDKDRDGICESCGGWHLRPTSTMGRTWCNCQGKEDFLRTDSVFFWTESGHGWLHRTCGQLLQIG